MRYNPGRYRLGYTLIEVLLVVMILGIMTTIVLVSFTGTLRHQRLSTAVRRVAAAGRHARSLAVIGQREVALIFDTSRNVVTIRALKPRKGVDDADDAGVASDAVSLAEGDAFAETEAPASATEDDFLGEDITLQLEGVQIIPGERGGVEGQSEGGTFTVVYASNGRCSPYSVVLADGDGNEVTIDVDSVGAVRTQ